MAMHKEDVNVARGSGGRLDASRRALVVLSAALGTRDRAKIEHAIERAAVESDPVEVEEVLLQSYLFLGYPAALNAISMWRTKTGQSAPASTPDDWDGWRRRGESVCARVYGSQYERLRENIASLHPDMERWMVAEGYGKVLGRPALGLRVRELCIAAILAGQDAEAQLYAHLRGALNTGAELAEVDEVVELVCEMLSAERATATRDVWGKVRARRQQHHRTEG